MTLTAEDLAALRAAMRTAAAEVAEEVARRVVSEILAAGPTFGDVISDSRTPAEIAAAELEARRSADYEAEQRRWAAMPPEQLALEESRARLTRWHDAVEDLTARGVEVSDLADLEADMTPEELAEAKRGRPR